MKRRNRIILILVITLGACQLAVFGIAAYFNAGGAKHIEFGVTFSPYVARHFKLDPKEVLQQSLDDLGIKKYRIPVYWNVVEQKKGQYYFGDIDWQLNEIEKRGGEAILVIGRRVPRWPECHDPEWIDGMPEKAVQERVLNIVERTVNRYKNRNVVVAWQVENEPLLWLFGECPTPDPLFLTKEVNLVRSLDKRPIILTESGELATWTSSAALADMIGISIYRTVWDKNLGIFHYPLLPAYYKYRTRTLMPLVQKVFISELQAEPWERNPLQETPLTEQKIFMNEKKFKKAITFAKRAGFNEVYLWGVEWWAWLKTQGDNSMWDTVKETVLLNLEK